jgi:hypothetical protein
LSKFIVERRVESRQEWQRIPGVYSNIVEALQALSEQSDSHPEQDGRITNLETQQIYNVPHFRPMI